MKTLANLIVFTTFIVSALFLLNSAKDLTLGIILSAACFNLAAIILQAFVYNYKKRGFTCQQ